MRWQDDVNRARQPKANQNKAAMPMPKEKGLQSAYEHVFRDMLVEVVYRLLAVVPRDATGICY